MKDHMDLKVLLIDTSSKSIIVIGDIVCSLDLTGQCNGKEMKEKQKTEVNSKVTVSGLLNFIGRIWSVCAGVS